MTALAIRLAEPKDAAQLAVLITAAFATQPPTNPPPSAMHVTETTLRDHFATGGGAILAEGAQMPEAAILWQVEAASWRLSRLCVLTLRRRRGLALTLLNAAIAEAGSRDVKELRLATRLCLLGNRSLFAKAGFREISLHCHPGFRYPTYVEMSRKPDEHAAPALPVYETPIQTYRFAVEGAAHPGIEALLARIAAHSATLYPPEGVHMLPAERIAAEDVWFIVARDNAGSAQGCGAIVRDGAQGEVKRMFVDESARGQGLASAILAMLEHRAYMHGVRLIQLETGPKQPAAIALYEREGYRHRGPFGTYEASLYSVFMEKHL